MGRGKGTSEGPGWGYRYPEVPLTTAGCWQGPAEGAAQGAMLWSRPWLQQRGLLKGPGRGPGPGCNHLDWDLWPWQQDLLNAIRCVYAEPYDEKIHFKL